jgi:hypothetical protein
MYMYMYMYILYINININICSYAHTEEGPGLERVSREPQEEGRQDHVRHNRVPHEEARHEMRDAEAHRGEVKVNVIAVLAIYWPFWRFIRRFGNNSPFWQIFGPRRK